ncbi:hypothetical protein JCM14036_25480 [Desulfotomaculum defluvii]
MYIVLYVFSLVLMGYTFFVRMLITSDIPPSFTNGEVLHVIVSSILMLVLFIWSINKATNITKNIIILIPNITVFMFYSYGFFNCLRNYIYYNDQMLLMDLIFLFEILLVVTYCLYNLRKKKTKTIF